MEKNEVSEVSDAPKVEKLDAMQIIKDGEPLDLLDLWMKLSAYVFIDTNADKITMESKAGLKIEAKFTTLEGWPEKTDKPKFVKTIGDALKVSDIRFEFIGGAPTMTPAKETTPHAHLAMYRNPTDFQKESQKLLYCEVCEAWHPGDVAWDRS